MLGLRTLVLDVNYMPVSLFPVESIPAEDAVTRVLNGTCHTVFEYDRKILTPTLEMNWPSVIARNAPDRTKRKGVKLDRETIFYRDHGLCAYCEKPLTVSKVTFDHVYPQARGGAHEWTNVVSACMDCNSRKGDKMPVGEWKPKVRPYAPNYYQLVSARKKFPIYVPDESWMNFFGDWEADVVVRAA